MTNKERLEDVRSNIFGARTKMIEAQRDINILLDRDGMQDEARRSLNKCFMQIQLAFERMGFALDESYKAENVVGEVAE